MKEEINKWINQADHDFLMAKNIVADGGYDTCAFLCQQAVEKYLKALYIIKNEKNPPKTHYLDELAKQLGSPGFLIDIAKELASDYMISRYPDAATMAPFEEYTEADALNKIEKAEKAIVWIKSQL